MSALNFAIWASEASTNTPRQLIISELHVNLWKLDETDSDSVIDFGILYKKPSFNHVINFFIDYDKDLTCNDLNYLLTDSSEVLYTIFNDFLHEESCKNHYNSSKLVRPIEEKIYTPAKQRPLQARIKKNHKSEFKNNDDRKNFCVFQLSDQNYEIKKFSRGRLIEFTGTPNNVERCTNCISDNAYIRFRLKGSFIEDSFVCDESATSKLQKFTSRLTIIETKINVLRTLPTSIREKLQISHPEIKKINFFMMCPSKDSIEIASTPHSSVRCLEGEIWNRYFDKVDKYTSHTQKIFAYQWKKTGEKNNNAIRGFEDYSLMIRIKSDIMSIWRVLGVGTLVLCGGLFINGVFSLLECYLPKILSSQ